MGHVEPFRPPCLNLVAALLPKQVFFAHAAERCQELAADHLHSVPEAMPAEIVVTRLGRDLQRALLGVRRGFLLSDQSGYAAACWRSRASRPASGLHAS